MTSEGNFDIGDRMDSPGKASSVRKIQKQERDPSVNDINSAAFLLYSRPYNPSFARQESLMSSRSEAPSTSTIDFEDICRKRKGSCDIVGTDDLIFMGRRDSDKSRISRISKSKTQSDSSVENLVLKKTDETINFSFNNFGPDTIDNMHCAAERLRLGADRKSSGEVTTRSENFFSDNLLNEINADSQGEEFLSSENISQSCIPFQTYETTIRGSGAVVTETKGEKKLLELWRKNFSLNKTQIVAFFGKKKEEKQKKKKKKKRKKDIEDEEFVRLEFLGPPVSWREDHEIKLHMRNFYFRTLELIVITAITLLMLSSSMFYLTNVTTKIFFDTKFPKNSSASENSDYFQLLSEVRTLDHFWEYAETTMLKLLYWDFYYSKVNPISYTEQDDKKMFQENQILGVARMRQVRVKKNSCKVFPHVKRFFSSCYPPYSVLLEDTTPIRLDMDNSITATAWKYTKAKTLESIYYWGDLSVYGGGGYYLDLAPTLYDAKRMIKELRKNKWVTRGTRAIFIDFNIYNANVNLFCICKIVVEVPASGGVIPSVDFNSVKIIRYLTVQDFMTLGFEILFVLFVMYDIWEVMKAISSEKLYYFYYFWNYLDLVIILLCFLYFILGIVRYIYAKSILAVLDDRPYTFTDFSEIKKIQTVFNHIIAILLFCNWLRFFSYLTFTKNMMQFSKTIKKSVKDMLLFLPLFLTMLTAFALMAFTFFGQKKPRYRTVLFAFFTLLEAFLGHFNYQEIFDADHFLGPIFFIMFVFFVFFVMLNVFIAIINDAYMTVKSQVIPESPKTGEYIKRAIVNTFTCCRPRRKRTTLSGTMRKKLLFHEIQNALKGAGFKREEIQIFFHKYNINCNNFLDDTTKSRIMKDLELKRINFNETSEQFQINLLRRRLDEYRERMDNWEMKLQPVIDKVDVLLQRLP